MTAEGAVMDLRDQLDQLRRDIESALARWPDHEELLALAELVGGQDGKL